MEVKNLFDAAVKTDIVARINQLTPQNQPSWGKMNVGQMLAHCQGPLGVALGVEQPKAGFLIRLIGPLFKHLLYNDTPFKQNIATAKSFIVTDERNFTEEKSKLVDMVNRFTQENLTDGNHPIFGKLTPEQWSKSNWKHLDHHLRQFGV